MEGICVERVKIYINTPIVSLNSMEVYCAVNEHAKLRLEVQVRYQENYADILEKLLGSNVQVDEVLEVQEGLYSRLFTGIVKDVSLIKINTFLTIVISGVSYSDQLDREKRNCSFQNVEQTYKSVMQDICIKEKNVILKWGIQKELITGRLIIQYQETNWEFLKRISSQMHVPVVVDEKSAMPNIQIGISKGIRRNWNVDNQLNSKKEINKKYKNILSGNNVHTDFFNYSFRCRDNYNLGDWFQIGNDTYFIVYKEILFCKGELIFNYKIIKENALWIPEVYNNQIKGISLFGTVKAVEKENVFVQLDIDTDKHAEYAFPWKPVYGNFVYCMPECEERVMIHIPEEDEQEASAIHVVRKNGGNNKCPQGYGENFHAVQNRVLTTDKEKQLRLYPKELSLESMGNGNVLELRDSKGISAYTPQKIKMEADGEIIFYASKMLFSSPQEILLKGMESSIQINRNFNIYNPNIIENCGIDSGRRKPVSKSTFKGNKNWINNYQALGAMPTICFEYQEFDSRCMCAMSSLPMISDGKATVSMSELLNGTKIEETSFPSAFSSMENQTLNGGYPPPNLEE